jgi:hypothetical protein
MKAQFIKEDIFVRGKDPKSALNIGMASEVFRNCGKPFGEGGAYSFDYYGPDNWMDIIQWLLSRGYTPEETELVLRSKLMRWSADNAAKFEGDCTLKDFLRYNNDLTPKKQTQIDDFLDEYLPDPLRKKRVKMSMTEDAMGGVPAPMATLNNTPGMGNAVPPSSTSAGSGDVWDASIGPIHTQTKSKGIKENNISPYDKLGVAMAKKMRVPLTFKKGKGNKDVEQIKVDEDIDLSTSIMTFDEWAKKFRKK